MLSCDHLSLGKALFWAHCLENGAEEKEKHRKIAALRNCCDAVAGCGACVGAGPGIEAAETQIRTTTMYQNGG